jgi:hypothetical protein
MTKKTDMTQEEALKQAKETFDRILGNPNDGNARIIAARRGNNSRKFKPADMIKRANTSAAKHVEQARKVVKDLGKPSLDRFKT